MTQMANRWEHLGVLPPLEYLRTQKREATTALLGDTIGFSDHEWREPSRLTGWTRAHVATHVARNADALRRLLRGVMRGEETSLYPGAINRADDIERGSRRSGLDLQIDLDTSAGLLNQTFDELEDADPMAPVHLTDRLHVPAQFCVIARLSEIALHHIDLDCGQTLAAIPPETSQLLAAWELFRGYGDPRLPSLRVSTTSGLSGVVGPEIDGDLTTVSGTNTDVLGWLSGRGSADSLESTIPLPHVLPAH